jgi:hypothetical protein
MKKTIIETGIKYIATLLMLNNILIKLPMIIMIPATIRQVLMTEVIPFMSTFFVVLWS